MTRKCQNCKTRNGMSRFEGETFVIDHAGMTAAVKALSGWRCGACGEVEFDAESARRYAAAGDELVLSDRERQSKEIRRIRRKLGLSQVAAGRLTGGGHNAFSRYERGIRPIVRRTASSPRTVSRRSIRLTPSSKNSSGSSETFPCGRR
jgi:HTH-type transcriptional regulator/antitoxin MqsA